MKYLSSRFEEYISECNSSNLHEELKEINDKLTQEELYVLKDKGTERPFSGEFDTFFEDGVYKCKNC